MWYFVKRLKSILFFSTEEKKASDLSGVNKQRDKRKHAVSNTLVKVELTSGLTHLKAFNTNRLVDKN